VLTTRPDASTQSVIYDGLIETSINELGQEKIVEKNPAGQVVKVTDDAGTAILYEYDTAGQLTQTRIQGVGGTTSSYQYDIRGNKIADSDPDKGAWTYGYNALGLLASQTDAKGQVTEMTYDVLGRMKIRIDNATAPNPGNRTSEWTYDTEEDGSNAKGKLTGVSGGDYFKTIFYDNLQREEQVIETIEDITYTTSTSYEGTSSRVATITYPSGYVIANAYNSSGHLWKVTDGSGANLWRAFVDDARGNITEYKLGSQVSSIRAYDDKRGWIKSILSTKVSNGAILQDLTYDFNKLGNLSERAHRKFSSTPLIEDINYDNLNRLKKSTVEQGGAGGWSTVVEVDYDDDGLGNIDSKSDVGTYTYGQLGAGCTVTPGKHAVSGISGEKNASYCYDQNGNMTSGDGRTIAYTPYDLPRPSPAASRPSPSPMGRSGSATSGSIRPRGPRPPSMRQAAPTRRS
jgi:YD repeat-containing protein